MPPSLSQIESQLLSDSAKFYGDADARFAGAPKPLLEAVGEKIKKWRGFDFP
jgi:hypothetical protein